MKPGLVRSFEAPSFLMTWDAGLSDSTLWSLAWAWSKPEQPDGLESPNVGHI